MRRFPRNCAVRRLDHTGRLPIRHLADTSRSTSPLHLLTGRPNAGLGIARCPCRIDARTSASWVTRSPEPRIGARANEDIVTGARASCSDTTLPRGRVTFTVFHSMDDPMLMAWARFRHPFVVRTAEASPRPARSVSRTVSTRTLHRSAPGRPEEGSPGLWRLLATNNRELGRSFNLYSSVEAAREHVERLQSDGARLQIDIVPGLLNSSRGWIITHEGSPVMTSSRWYASSSTGAEAAAGALAAFVRALISPLVDHSPLSGGAGRRRILGASADA